MRFKIVIEDQAAIERSTKFIGGWHGLGEVGYITVQHIVHTLEMKRIAAIMSSGAPPFISVQNSQLKLPFEIYGSKDYDFSVFVPHLQPYRHLQIEFSEKLAEWVLENYEEAYFVGGVDNRLKNQEFNLQYIPTRKFIEKADSDFVEEIEKHILDSGLFVAGPLAIMLGYLDLNSFPALGILSYTERDRPDPLGATHSINKLEEILGVSIPIEELIENAKIIEEEIKKQLEPMKDSEKQVIGSESRFYT